MIRSVVGMLALMTLLTGVAYPLVITGVAQVVFPRQADGSLIEKNGAVIGSALLAQGFAKPEYFHPRPSAAGKNGYDATSSSGSNEGVTTKTNNDAIAQRAAAEKNDGSPVPADLVTASGSGLDPDVSPAAALYQVPRVAKARNLPEEKVRALVEAHVEDRTFGFLGEPRVNVLELNLALDELR